MFRCLDLSDSAEGLGQVNEIKDTQRCFFPFLQSSKVGFEERSPTVGSAETLPAIIRSFRREKPSTQLRSTIVMSSGPFLKIFAPLLAGNNFSD